MILRGDRWTGAVTFSPPGNVPGSGPLLFAVARDAGHDGPGDFEAQVDSSRARSIPRAA